MAKRGLRLELRAALRKVLDTGQPVERLPVQMEAEGIGRSVGLSVEGVAAARRQAPVHRGVQRKRRCAASRTDAAASTLEDTTELERELSVAREELQSTVEEYDTALEELKSANEELQSTNEELETSKEEIQSVNEELQTTTRN